MVSIATAIGVSFALGLLLGTSVAAATGGPWAWPLAGPHRVTRGFDPPLTTYGSGHRGVDLAGAAGQRVGSAGAGVVTFAAPLAGRGVITVRHAGGLRTTYEPVLATVHIGARVIAGQPIGRLAAGHRGCPVGACLHWGLLRGEVYLDPLTLVGAGRVRLLPDPAPVGQHDGLDAPSPRASRGAAGAVTGRARAATGAPVSRVSVPARSHTSAAPSPALTGALAVILGLLVMLARHRPP